LAVKKREIVLHDEQIRAYTSKKRIIVMCCGIQGGKTFNGALWMRTKVSEFNDADANFIVTAPTSKILKQATEPEFLKLFDGMGKYNKTEGTFYMPRNRHVFLRTFAEGRQPNAIEGITNVYAIWGDEAGMNNKQCWTNMEGRAAFRQCQIFLSTTPYYLNWLYKDIYKEVIKGNRTDVEFVQFRSVDNPHFPAEEFDRLRSLLDPRVFAMKYEGQFNRMAGLVYMDFDEVENSELTFEPDRVKHYICAGIDWGYTNQYAIVVRAVSRIEKLDFQIAEFYKSYLDPNQKLEVAKQIMERYGVEMFYADNEQPDMIAMFNKAGIPTTAAPKYPGSRRDNIERHNGLIRTREYKVFTDKCPATIDEYSMYHYPEDKGEEENPSELPVKAHDHLMSANEYATQCTESYREEARKRFAFTPGKSRLDRLLEGSLYPEQEGYVDEQEEW